MRMDRDTVQMEIYVAPYGCDTNAGTQAAPFATPERAQAEVRKYNGNMTGDIIVHFAPGYYQLCEALVFDERDSGTNGCHIIYKGDGDGAGAILGGGTKIEGWERTELLGGKIWKAPADIEDTRNLWINGYPAQRATGSHQYMYTGNLEAAEAGLPASDDRTDEPAEVKSYGIKVPMQEIFLALEHPEEVELVWPNQWVHQRTPVKNIYVDPDDPNLAVFEMDMPYWEWANTKEGDFTNPVKWDSYPDVVNYDMTFYLENALALLDESGEFYFDKTAKVIYYYPYEQEDLTTAETYAGTTEYMVRVMGADATDRVENITFENLSFRYGAWNEPNVTGFQITQTDHIVNKSRNEVASGGRTMPGQVTLNFTRNVNIYNCEFRCLGSSALVMDNGVADTEVVGNRFMDISGTGIMIDSYEHRGILPEGRVRCDNILVANNVIHRPANQYFGTAGISMYMPSNTIVRNNDIKGTPYSGMVAGWGWGRAEAFESVNDKIINNKIEDVMKVLTDGGHIYTLDRVHKCEIAENYLVKSGDNRGGIYLDQGSRSYRIHDNVVMDSERWFFGRSGAKLQDIQLSGNYYDAVSKEEIDDDNIIVVNNTPVKRGADGMPEWPDEALAIIARAGLEEEYRHLLEDADLPEWRKDLLDRMPRELIRAQIPGELEEEGVITIKAMDHVAHSNTKAYVKNAGEAVRYSDGGDCYSVWTIDMEEGGTYTVKVIGTGELAVDSKAVTGRLYIDGELLGTIALNTNERWNPWDNPLETVFGAAKLEAGTHTIRFEAEGGTYVMDKIKLAAEVTELETN